jgi:hypothetical protein
MILPAMSFERLRLRPEPQNCSWLSDQAWAAIEPHLPRGLPGKPRVDDRRVISGIP